MGMIDRIFGRKLDLEDAPSAANVSRADADAVAAYERMLRTASSDVIERVHLEAFEKLTPAQLDLLFERFSQEASVDEERPANARPASVAKAAATAEARRPGTITKTLKDADTGISAKTWVGLGLLDTVSTLAITSVIWTSFSAGSDASASSETSTDAEGADSGFAQDYQSDFGFWGFDF